MAFWCRLKQSQLRSLSNQFKRCYFQIHGACSVNHTTSRTRIWGFGNPDSFIHNSQFEFCNKVRFFAAPVQAKQKGEEEDSDGPRLNEKITAQYIRLVTDEGHSVVPRQEALERARRLKLDLVEVARNDKPPVCKLMDYHREKYKQQLEEKDRSKKRKSEVSLRQGECKEVQVEGKIEQKDLQMKANQAKRLMDKGYRVKCVAKLIEKKAMADVDQNLGGVLTRLYDLIKDVSVVESGPRMEKRLAYVIVRHVKFGPSKKGSKKDFIVEDARSQAENDSSISAPAINPVSESPVLDSTTPESFPTEAPLGTENRYKKDPRNRFPPSKETSDPSRLQPQQFPNQGRQPQQFPNQGRQPQQYPNQGRQPQQYPKQGRQPQQYPEEQGVPAVQNRYKKAANPNSSLSNSHGSRRPDYDRGGQGR